jgi:LPXTG-motif cell wall-anchored protein
MGGLLRRLLYLFALSAITVLMLAPAALAQPGPPPGLPPCPEGVDQFPPGTVCTLPAEGGGYVVPNPDGTVPPRGESGVSPDEEPAVKAEVEVPAKAEPKAEPKAPAPVPVPKAETKAAEAKAGGTEAEAPKAEAEEKVVEQKKSGAKATEQKKSEAKKEEKKELPKTGGSATVSLLALGASVLLVGGGLLVRRMR